MELKEGMRLRHRRFGYSVEAKATDFGFILIAIPPNHLRNWALTHADVPDLDADWVIEGV